ncbi:hypothetical protein HUS70_12460 [Pandoraea nosoerga]|uniref:hypothetical protein n=1 Tax=Pandoraea nosoerga TaxID=2508296 RepID=UPI00197EAF54|nr:hypothetical protein [Pandoraea nosoerga]MBN4666269.1 hypothetical protein [Pandoraea nosoerga]MBN4676324.1 hypothetical protein [Pandoraea nosoerga]MBN4681361.1 hypothetical protein [Pandoraea nosoerga]MBN4745435.1 hypothetical protein [Pandoraea nosoerga]
MDFIYNHELISTQDEIKISVADLRDLIQAYHIKDPEQAHSEYAEILKAILWKNRLPSGVVQVVN